MESKQVVFKRNAPFYYSIGVKECGFTIKKGELTGTSFIEQCSLFYECKIIHKVDMDAQSLEPNLFKKFYKDGDMHRIFTGEIVNAYIKK